MKSIVTRVTKVRKKQRGDPSLILGRCGLASDGVLSIRCCVWFVLRIRCCVWCVLRIRCCVRLRQMSCVGGWLRPDSRLAFQRQVRQTHRTHRTQSNIFADVAMSTSILVASWAFKISYTAGTLLADLWPGLNIFQGRPYRAWYGEMPRD